MNPRLVSLRNHWECFVFLTAFFSADVKSGGWDVSTGYHRLCFLTSASFWLIRLEGGEREFFDISVISFSAAFIFPGYGKMGKAAAFLVKEKHREDGLGWIASKKKKTWERFETVDY